MDKKIMICGSSGTGKTTLAKHMSELYELPYVNTSASKVWPEFGFKNHEDAHTQSVSTKIIGVAYQRRILIERIHALEKMNHYITDRSFVDNTVYNMLELGHLLNALEVDTFTQWCSRAMKDVDGLIFLRWNDEVMLEDNGHRILNPLFQEMTDQIFNWVINEQIIRTPNKVLELIMWDFETRIQIVDEWVKGL